MSACDICGNPATTTDGIVGAYLCDETRCLDQAWDRAFAPTTRTPEESPDE